MNSKHIPVRQCIVCGNRFPKSELLRVASSPKGIIFDKDYKACGRGAYVCKNDGCIDSLAKKRRLDRAFRKSVNLSVYEEILEEIDRT